MAGSRHMRFVIPDPGAFLSGGNWYNAGLVAGLDDLNISHVLVTEPSLAFENPATAFVVDSLYLFHPALADMTDRANSVLLAHHLDCLYPLSVEWFRREFLPLLRQYSRIVVTGEFLEHFLLSNGIPESQVVLIEPVPLHRERARKHAGDKLECCLVANLVERKGVLALLEALDRLGHGEYYNLRIAGEKTLEPEYASDCLDLIRSSKNLSKHVTYLGSQDFAGIRALLKRSNCAISASGMETFGMSMQEAVASGTPLFALDRGNASRHIEPGFNGMLFQDMDFLVKGILSLAREPEVLQGFLDRAANYDPGYPENWASQASTLVNAIA